MAAEEAAKPNGVTFLDKESGEYRERSDPLENPRFTSDLKMCTKTYDDPTGALLSDGFPVRLTDLIFCPKLAKCCGAPDLDREGEEVPQENCCNK